MKTSITSGLSPLEASEIESEWAGSSLVRKRLVAVLKGKQELMLKKRRSEDNYESPNWALSQADGVGYERAISEVISLLS